MKICFCFLLPLVIASSVDQRKNLSVTIYNQNYAIVKDTRQITFDTGISYLSIDDVASTIQTETVAFRPKDKTLKIFVLEQNFQNNIVGKSGILQKYLGKLVTIYVKLATNKVVDITGKLLAFSPSYIIHNKDGVQIYDDVAGIKLQALPQGLLTVPALVWKVNNPGNLTTTSDCEIAYKATGFTWKSDYTLILNDQETLMDFAGWVTIDNNSGKKYEKVRVKLIAGEVNTVRQYTYLPVYKSMRSFAPSGGSAVTEKSFGDYHMYTIKRKVDINQSSTKQIEFIPKVNGAKVNKYYRVEVSTGGLSQTDVKAESMIKFANTKDNKLGLPLPKGTVRTYKEDSSDGSLEFVGQDSIQHTPKDQDVKLKIGNAFDLVVKKTVVSRTTKDSGSWEANIRMSITNHRANHVSVVMQISNGYGDNLEMDWKQKEKLIKENANRYNVTLRIAPDEKRTVEWSQVYRVHY